MAEKVTKQTKEINGIKYHTRSGNGELYSGIEKLVQNLKGKFRNAFFYTAEKVVEVKVEKQEDGSLKYDVSYPGANSLPVPFEVTSYNISQSRTLAEEYFKIHPEGKGIVITTEIPFQVFDPFGIKRRVYGTK